METGKILMMLAIVVLLVYALIFFPAKFKNLESKIGECRDILVNISTHGIIEEVNRPMNKYWIR